uniref:TMhelix containing protein n=1 Tax=Panagrolaimus sp. PS1159 TaxID=55785 RepID=A0AC35FYI3_9BILA
MEAFCGMLGGGFFNVMMLDIGLRWIAKSIVEKKISSNEEYFWIIVFLIICVPGGFLAGGVGAKIYASNPEVCDKFMKEFACGKCPKVSITGSN